MTWSEVETCQIADSVYEIVIITDSRIRRNEML